MENAERDSEHGSERQWLTTRQWGEQQDPPLSMAYVEELVREGRVAAPDGTKPMRPGRDYLIPADAEKLEPGEETRARWREKMRKYKERHG